MKPLAIDLYCGLGGWTDGLLAEGFDVIGFDNEPHEYDDLRYPAQLVLQDVTTLHGSQFAEAELIVASPPCTEYSYMAMPWGRAKQIGRAIEGIDTFPDAYSGSRTVAELNRLFDACFRIQREATTAKGRPVPLIVENVVGAQRWVGRARWRYGSYYLWGDVPALMPITTKAQGVKVGGLDWSTPEDESTNGCFRDSALKRQSAHELSGIKQGGDWFNASEPSISRMTGSRSKKRKKASAMIAKIPFELSRYIASVYRP